MSTQSTLQTDSRRKELGRLAKRTAKRILQSGIVNVHSVRYNVDPESNQIELFVVVDGASSAAFERNTELPISQSAADEPEMRQDRENQARMMLGIGRVNPQKFDIRLVSIWTAKTEATVR